MMLAAFVSSLLFAGAVSGYAIIRDDDSASSVWQPAVGAPWQIILRSTLKIDHDKPQITPDVGIYDIDLFANTKDGTDKSIIEALHKINKKVICYFSAGSFEADRPDSAKFTTSDKGNALEHWPEEKWLDLNSQNVRSIMAARIKLAADMGCDAIDPDNVDGQSRPLHLNISHCCYRVAECCHLLQDTEKRKAITAISKLPPKTRPVLSRFLQLRLRSVILR